MTAFAPTAPRAEVRPADRPRIELIPDSVTSSAPEVLALVDLLRIPLLPWQRHDLAAMLGERADGKWAAPQVGLVCPRQNGKSYLMAARILAGLFVLGEEEVVHTAHRVETALEVFHLVDRFARSHPTTKRMIRQTLASKGRESIILTTGQRFRVQARTGATGRGMSGDLLILDEALELRDQKPINALIPTLSARPNSQLIYVSSAGDPGSVVLEGVRRRGLAGAPNLAYLEHSAPPDADLDDEEAWAAGNPSLGSLLSLEAIRRERDAMTDEGFRVERMGIWASDRSSSVIPTVAWTDARLTRDDHPIPGRCGLGFDVSTDREWASIVIAYPTEGGRVHVRTSRHDRGDRWLRAEVAALAASLKVPVTYDDAGPARDVGQLLELEGVEVDAVSGRDFAAGCARLVSGIVAGDLTVHPDAALDLAARTAGSRRIAEAWAFARRDATEPISPLTAAVLAVVGADKIKPLPPFRIR